jgi:hypothetical protein
MKRRRDMLFYYEGCPETEIYNKVSQISLRVFLGCSLGGWVAGPHR